MAELTRDEMKEEIRELKKELKQIKNDLADLPLIASDVYKVGRKYRRVNIAYNLETGAAQVIDHKEFADNLTMARHKMDELTGKKFLEFMRIKT